MKQNSFVNWFMEMNEDDFVDRLYWQSFLYEKNDLKSQELRVIDIFDPGKIITINNDLQNSPLIYQTKIPFINDSFIIVPSKSILLNITSDLVDFDVIKHIVDFIKNEYNINLDQDSLTYDSKKVIEFESIKYRNNTIKKYLVLIHFKVDHQFYDDSYIGLNEIEDFYRGRFLLNLSRSIADILNNSDDLDHKEFHGSYYRNLYKDFRLSYLYKIKTNVKKHVYPIFKYRDKKYLYEKYNIGEKQEKNDFLDKLIDYYDNFMGIFSSYEQSIVDNDPYMIKPITKVINSFVQENEELRSKYV